jgi:hypothetical protein
LERVSEKALGGSPFNAIEASNIPYKIIEGIWGPRERKAGVGWPCYSIIILYYYYIIYIRNIVGCWAPSMPQPIGSTHKFLG